MGKYFGTDGFRGEANVTLTSKHAYDIGRFLGWYYSSPNHKAKIVIGKDTRLSSYMFEYSIVAGLTASGADAYMMHVTTTPSISYAIRTDNFDCGIMISASHNPYTDNGIKLVNAQGEKMDDQTTLKIEEFLDSDKQLPLATGDKIGRIIDYYSGRNRYIGYLISTSVESFRDKKIALDCANGASWAIAKSVFEALGASTYVINASPDGTNINTNAGSTHIHNLCKYVVDNNLDCGFAFDGDADRCIAVDEKGNEVNGDHIMYILAKYLNLDTVVTTIMSNMGLYKALKEDGIKYEQTVVGDRFVYENMVKNHYKLGGEQSGHIIMRKYATTGDGILTSIMIMNAVVSSKKTLSQLASPVKMFPQILENIRVSDKKAITENEEILSAVEKANEQLGDSGRMLLRESGTEPLIRVMCEAQSEEICREYVDKIVNLIKEKI